MYIKSPKSGRYLYIPDNDYQDTTSLKYLPQSIASHLSHIYCNQGFNALIEAARNIVVHSEKEFYDLCTALDRISIDEVIYPRGNGDIGCT